MIISVNEINIEEVFAFCENSLLGTKISCQLKTYGIGRSFLNVWCCLDGNSVKAVISKFEDSITLIADDVIIYSEIKSFLDMIGFSSLCCSEALAKALEYEADDTKNAYIFSSGSDCSSADELTEEKYRCAYELICKNIPGSFEDSKNSYLSFLSDFTFRKRRGTARFKGTVIEGKVAACALTSAETDTAAIISGVACDSSFRMKGLGKRTVLALANELKKENKTVYVIALNKAAEGFYEHIGFKNTDRISFIERK